ncbi:DNA-binding protein [candidate division WOR-1 bacterium RIFOXYB2_FULL_42_35]|uniref:DNA-binding protein n=1 Tax=candidate division WOR-1 bacterium RIFOXYC2_FULL_41_25 TaxID=1802586 RepID=A0A1F4TIT7_UNCSA|nr:MAG: DNA-binding protein [candidate division WOR-1 bacterium RIFOXYA2_FULL_41_14]OGC21629.1 MAG: DNA-binding protein [candidate division WOR-1 bacterium RIFOXYB2_FULL_42_35]OGC32632.1 MAG: DNA-binding protein [candidate division WOR-1 bacterium RIFOXYC2_FULL_41_25]OGC41690.1 MAG: DNA-binding protein [candidate division WOR-1 bacterium RIFOXYD2_FULL_41_8]
MNKKQLASKVANKIDMTIAKSEMIIDSVLESISEALIKGEKVRLVGFGNFVVRKRKGRIGRNPQTGAKITIDSSKAPAFVPGINLKKAVKGKNY